MKQGIRQRLITWWAATVTHRPGTVVKVTLMLAVLSVVFTAARMTFQSDRNQLISAELPWNARFVAWQKAFSGSEDLVVVVDSRPIPGITPQHPVTDLVDALGQQLAADPHLEHVVWGFDSSQFNPKTVRMLPLEEMAVRVEQMAEAEPLLRSESVSDLLGFAAGMMQRQGASDATSPDAMVGQVDRFVMLLDGIATGLRTPDDEPFDLGRVLETAMADEGTAGDGNSQAEAGGGADWQYLQSGNGRLFFIRITPRQAVGQLAALEPAIHATRDVMARVLPQFPGYEAGLTGIEVVETDETEIATRDSTRSSILAVVLISIVLMTAFHSVRSPLLAVASLMVGMAWSFGFLTLAIGHLQVISVVFTVILLGLGIAFGIHLACSFERLRHQYPDDIDGFELTLRETFKVTGPGMVTGAVTTSAAFMTTLFTDFIGVAEMGLIAGVGVLLCLLAMVSLYPALLRIYKPGWEHFVAMDDRQFHLFDERWCMPFVRRPRVTLLTTLVLTLVTGVYVLIGIKFDYDLLKLQAPDVPAVEWAMRITQDGGESIYYGVSIVDSLEEARERAAKFRAQPALAEQLGGVGLLIPSREPEKIVILEDMRTRLASALAAATAPTPSASDAPVATPTGADLLSRVRTLQLGLRLAAGTDLPPALRESLDRAGRAMTNILTTAGEMDAETRDRRLRRLEAGFRTFRAEVAGMIQAALDTTPLELQDIPEELLRSYRSDDGRLVLEISPRIGAGETLLEPIFLQRFIGAMEKVDPNVTGVVVQIYKSGSLIKNSYIQAGIWAMVLVFLLVLIDFRNVHDAIVCLVPVAVGFTLTFGIMRLVGMHVNPANIMVLPLMFGIGVDAGVHVMHRFRQHPDESPPGLTRGTGKGITITSITTVIGFASLMIASHRGIKGLGFVLSVGITLTMLACWIVVPAWLALRRRRGEGTRVPD